MKNLILAIALIATPLLSFADTVDYWHVSINDQVIARFNSATKNPALTLKKSDYKEGDKISIRYGDDTPCSKCMFSIMIMNDKDRRLRANKTTEFWGPISFDLFDLIHVGEQNETSYYDFKYWESSGGGGRPQMINVLRLTIK